MKGEVVMTKLSEQSAAFVEQSVADAATRLTKANKNALDFLMGAQKVMLEELVFAGNEMLERTRTETHLLSEFVSKMAGSHSVKDLKTMSQQCGQHQIDFIRRDSERLFKHGERMIEATAKLFGNRPES
jgi:menaquinone-dependent protoporphyrinogen IX oxidase